MPFTCPQFIFYGGKGGVGKTTCAAARAVAEARAGRRVLVVSTDPAHSLGDAFNRKLSRRPARIVPRLDAVELDAPRAFARWLSEHRSALADIVEHGTWLDRDDAASMLDLPIPGVDELVGLLEIAELSRSGYDLVVVDTAPTGHTLRLMAAPRTVAVVADVLDSLQEEHRFIRDRLARVGHVEAADELISTIARQAADVASSLRDAQATMFVWVTLPERLSIAESEDGIHALTRLGVPVSEVVVNQLLADVDKCAMCRARRADERRMLATIRASLVRGRRLRVVPALLKEPQGARALSQVGRFLTGECVVRTTITQSSRLARAPLALVARSGRGHPVFGPEMIAALGGAQLVFVGGKGGVGKTTVAAALALRLAAKRPAQSILLLSTDPAHSLTDVFGAAITNVAAPIRSAPQNLFGRELNAQQAFRDQRRALEAAMADVGRAPNESLLRGANAEGRLNALVGRLLDLTPPGIDELFAMLSVVDARSRYDVVVVDSAPTGHALRLLAMPDAARAWVQALLRMLLKYRDVVKPGPLAADLVHASRSIRELQAALRDRKKTRFIVVTRAARVPRAETERLMARLHALAIAPVAIVVNARTFDPGRCRRCRSTARAERRELAALRPPRDCVIIQTPLVVPPPRGAVQLNRWAKNWTTSDS